MPRRKGSHIPSPPAENYLHLAHNRSWSPNEERFLLSPHDKRKYRNVIQEGANRAKLARNSFAERILRLSPMMRGFCRHTPLANY